MIEKLALGASGLVVCCFVLWLGIWLPKNSKNVEPEPPKEPERIQLIESGDGYDWWIYKDIKTEREFLCTPGGGIIEIKPK